MSITNLSTFSTDENGNILIYSGEDYGKFTRYYNQGAFDSKPNKNFLLMNNIELNNFANDQGLISSNNSPAIYWDSICYGNGKFVATTTDISANKIMTSTDGIVWTAKTANSGWMSICYGNGIFVAVGWNTSNVMTSSDGVNWVIRSTGASRLWNSVCYGNGLFVAVAQDNTNQIMTSPDGITWTIRAAAITGTEAYWDQICYGNGKFVAVSTDGSNIMTSSNGIDWTLTFTNDNDDIGGGPTICYGDGLFVILYSTDMFGKQTFMTSPDGINWTIRELNVDYSNRMWSSVCYGSGVYVAITDYGLSKIMTSYDGINWTIGTYDDGSIASTFKAVCCNDDGLFVAVASNGTNRTAIWKSPKYQMDRNATITSDYEMINNFKHTFNGNGYNINNVNLLTSAIENVGLFKINSGTIKNLSISGKCCGITNVSPLVITNNGSIIQCCNKSSVSLLTSNTNLDTISGGIAAINENPTVAEDEDPIIATIDRCYNTGNITGSNKIGGIVGSHKSGVIENCYNIGTITGGIASYTIGGIVGDLTLGHIKKCFNRGTISAYGGTIVGLYTGIVNEYKVDYCYYLTSTNKGFGNVNIVDSNNVVEKKTEAELALKSTFNTFDFTNTWCMSSDYDLTNFITTHDTYPSLKFEILYDTIEDTSWFNYSRQNNYIRTCSQLSGLATIVNDVDNKLDKNIRYNIIQVNDINFRGRCLSKFIGNIEYVNNINYDGQFYKIKNMILRYPRTELPEGETIPADNPIALFAYNSGDLANIILYDCNAYSVDNSVALLCNVNSGIISNVWIFKAYINSLHRLMGTLCIHNMTNGVIYDIYIDSSTISNLKFIDNTTLNEYTNIINHGVGGIIASNSGNCFNCMNLSNVSSISDNVGSVAGINLGHISECNSFVKNIDMYNTALNYPTMIQFPKLFSSFTNINTITGNNNVGGIAGSNYYKITVCENKNTITGNNNVGGIAGSNTIMKDNNDNIYSSGLIDSCKNNGSISAIRNSVGGITGNNIGSEVKDSYSIDGNISGVSKLGGLIGNNNGIITKCYSAMNILKTSDQTNIGSIIGYISSGDNDTDMVLCQADNSYGVDIALNSTILAVGGNSISNNSLDYPDDLVTKSITDLASQNTFDEWDFDNTWNLSNETVISNEMIDDTNELITITEPILSHRTNALPVLRNSITKKNRNIVPMKDKYQTIGTDKKQFKSIHADEMLGNMNALWLYTDSSCEIIINGGNSTNTLGNSGRIEL